MPLTKKQLRAKTVRRQELAAQADRMRRLADQAYVNSVLLQRLEALGDFDAHAQTVRQLARTVDILCKTVLEID